MEATHNRNARRVLVKGPAFRSFDEVSALSQSLSHGSQAAQLESAALALRRLGLSASQARHEVARHLRIVEVDAADVAADVAIDVAADVDGEADGEAAAAADGEAEPAHSDHADEQALRKFVSKPITDWLTEPTIDLELPALLKEVPPAVADVDADADANEGEDVENADAGNGEEVAGPAVRLGISQSEWDSIILSFGTSGDAVVAPRDAGGGGGASAVATATATAATTATASAAATATVTVPEHDVSDARDFHARELLRLLTTRELGSSTAVGDTETGGGTVEATRSGDGATDDTDVNAAGEVTPDQPSVDRNNLLLTAGPTPATSAANDTAELGESGATSAASHEDQGSTIARAIAATSDETTFVRRLASIFRAMTAPFLLPSKCDALRYMTVEHDHVLHQLVSV